MSTPSHSDVDVRNCLFILTGGGGVGQGLTLKMSDTEKGAETGRTH